MPFSFSHTRDKWTLTTRQRQYGLRIVALSDDFLSPTTDVYGWKLEGGSRVEAPAMVKLDKTYFMFASMMTGWDSNDNQYTTSTSLSSGWSGWKKFADSGSKVSNSLSPPGAVAGPGISLSATMASNDLKILKNDLEHRPMIHKPPIFSRPVRAAPYIWETGGLKII